MGEKILRRRLELGLTQKEIAKQLGINDQTVSRWETGESNPNIKHYPFVISFLDYYPFEIDDTFGGKIKRYRFINGMSRKKLAQLFKISSKLIQEIEENKSLPSINLGASLAQLFTKGIL